MDETPTYINKPPLVSQSNSDKIIEWQEHWMTRSLNNMRINWQMIDRWNWQCMAIQEQLVSNKFDAWLQDHWISDLIGNEIGHLAAKPQRTSQGIIKKTNISQQHVSLLGDWQRWSITVTVMFTTIRFQVRCCLTISDREKQIAICTQSSHQISGDMLSHHFRLAKTNCTKSKVLQIKSWSSILPSTQPPNVKFHFIHGVSNMPELLQLVRLRLDKLQSMEPWCQEQKTSICQLSWRLKQFSFHKASFTKMKKEQIDLKMPKMRFHAKAVHKTNCQQTVTTY